MPETALPPLPAVPRVSVAVPCRNERDHILACLESLAAADRDHIELHVLVCDGMSEDGTRGIVEAFVRDHPYVHLLDNTQRTTPFALNLGLRAFPFDVGIILGAHAEVATDHLQCAVAALRRDPSSGCAGGVIENTYANDASRRIGLAMSHPFGVGNAHFRTGTKSGYVDTVAFGAYRREVFDRIGWFDEDLDRNQDDEFNFRLTKAGYNILLDPAIRSGYVVRASFGKLYRQYEQYGLWKVFVNRKHRAVTTWRQLVPAAWVAFLVTCPFIMIFWRPAGLFMAIGIVSYLLVAVFSALQAGPWSDLPGILRAFLTLHAGYGIGYWHGIFRSLVMNELPGSRARALTR